MPSSELVLPPLPAPKLLTAGALFSDRPLQFDEICLHRNPTVSPIPSNVSFDVKRERSSLPCLLRRSRKRSAQPPAAASSHAPGGSSSPRGSLTQSHSKVPQEKQLALPHLESESRSPAVHRSSSVDCIRFAANETGAESSAEAGLGASWNATSSHAPKWLQTVAGLRPEEIPRSHSHSDTERDTDPNPHPKTTVNAPHHRSVPHSTSHSDTAHHNRHHNRHHTPRPFLGLSHDHRPHHHPHQNQSHKHNSNLDAKGGAGAAEGEKTQVPNRDNRRTSTAAKRPHPDTPAPEPTRPRRHSPPATLDRRSPSPGSSSGSSPTAKCPGVTRGTAKRRSVNPLQRFCPRTLNSLHAPVEPLNSGVPDSAEPGGGSGMSPTRKSAPRSPLCSPSSPGPGPNVTTANTPEPKPRHGTHTHSLVVPGDQLPQQRPLPHGCPAPGLEHSPGPDGLPLPRKSLAPGHAKSPGLRSDSLSPGPCADLWTGSLDGLDRLPDRALQVSPKELHPCDDRGWGGRLGPCPAREAEHGQWGGLHAAAGHDKTLPRSPKPRDPAPDAIADHHRQPPGAHQQPPGAQHPPPAGPQQPSASAPLGNVSKEELSWSTGLGRPPAPFSQRRSPPSCKPLQLQELDLGASYPPSQAHHARSPPHHLPCKALEDADPGPEGGGAAAAHALGARGLRRRALPVPVPGPRPRYKAPVHC